MYSKTISANESPDWGLKERGKFATFTATGRRFRISGFAATNPVSGFTFSGKPVGPTIIGVGEEVGVCVGADVDVVLGMDVVDGEEVSTLIFPDNIDVSQEEIVTSNTTAENIFFTTLDFILTIFP